MWKLAIIVVPAFQAVRLEKETKAKHQAQAESHLLK
jgi:hypothetical protein